eukprot:9414958-Heterocapsa_arctica.AAC.1
MDFPGLRHRGQLEYNISLQKWSQTTPNAGKGPEWNRKVLVQSGKVFADRMKEIEYDERINNMDLRVTYTFNLFTQDCTE